MFPKPSRDAQPRRRYGLLLVAALAGLATAALVSVAAAKTFTLEVAKGAQVMQNGAMSSENIAVNSRGRAAYTLSGDTKSHPKCTKANGCFTFWNPLTVAARKKPSKAPGIRGRLATWHRGGVHQVTLNGHPLYTFVADKSRDIANGNGIVSFGGTWHVVKTSRSSSSPTTSTGTGTNPYGY